MSVEFRYKARKFISPKVEAVLMDPPLPRNFSVCARVPVAIGTAIGIVTIALHFLCI